MKKRKISLASRFHQLLGNISFPASAMKIMELPQDTFHIPHERLTYTSPEKIGEEISEKVKQSSNARKMHHAMSKLVIICIPAITLSTLSISIGKDESAKLNEYLKAKEIIAKTAIANTYNDFHDYMFNHKEYEHKQYLKEHAKEIAQAKADLFSLQQKLASSVMAHVFGGATVNPNALQDQIATANKKLQDLQNGDGYTPTPTTTASSVAVAVAPVAKPTQVQPPVQAMPQQTASQPIATQLPSPSQQAQQEDKQVLEQAAPLLEKRKTTGLTLDENNTLNALYFKHLQLKSKYSTLTPTEQTQFNNLQLTNH